MRTNRCCAKKKLTKSVGSCTTWFIKKFLCCIDPFFYQYVTTHIRWRMTNSSILGGHGGRNRMVFGFTTTCAITINVVSSNLVHGDVYSMQHYVKMCVSYLLQVDDFLQGTPVSSTSKTDITEILLSASLSTTKQTKPSSILFLPKNKQSISFTLI